MPSISFDIAEGLDNSRLSPWRIFVVILIALSIILDAFDNQLLGLVAPVVAAEFGLKTGAFALVFAVGLIGVALGAVIGGLLGDRIGRKLTLIGSIVVFALPSMAIALTRSIEHLGILRFVAGLGLGGLMPSALALAAEYTPLRWRSTVVILVILCVPLGGVIAGLATVQLLDTIGWRQLFLIGGGAPLVFALLLVLLLPESPRFLLRRPGQRRRLERTLARLGMSVPAGADIADSAEPAAKVRISTLFSGPYRRDSLALLGAFFFSMIGSYSVQSWLPGALDKIGLDAATRGLATSIFNSGGMVGIVLGSALIMRFGSRAPMLILSGCGVACAILLTKADRLFAVTPALLYVVLAVHSSFMAIIQASIYSLAAHLYPSQIRATGVGISNGMGRAGAVASSFTGAFAITLGGGPGFFLSIAAAMLMTLIFLAMIRRHIPPA